MCDLVEKQIWGKNWDLRGKKHLGGVKMLEIWAPPSLLWIILWELNYSGISHSVGPTHNGGGRIMVCRG